MWFFHHTPPAVKNFAWPQISDGLKKSIAWRSEIELFAGDVVAGACSSSMFWKSTCCEVFWVSCSCTMLSFFCTCWSVDSRLTTSNICVCFPGESSFEVSSIVTTVMSFVGDWSVMDCCRFHMLLTILSTLGVDFIIPFAWFTLRSVYKHDGLGEFIRLEFMKSSGVEDAKISYDVPGESNGIMKTFTVGENFEAVVSSEVMLLFSEEFEYRNFRVLSGLASEVSLACLIAASFDFVLKSLGVFSC